jgi:acyl-coenzyme A synthetase/AMP-(fatty) acid ligase
MLCGPRGEDLAAPNLRAAYAAGAPLPTSVFEAFATQFGIHVAQLYGATEIGSVTFNAPWDEPFDRASVGRAMRDVSIRVLDLNSPTRSLPTGTQGQIAIRADSMFSGYLNADADLIDGHFPTGDLGYLDERGRLFLTGRIKLLIDIGGMKVNPLEVEAVLQQHAGVAECIVVPLRQSETVNRLKALVVPKYPRRPPDAAELRELARQQLAGYKVPRIFEFRDFLPRSPTGKVQRHLIDAEAAP